MSRKSARESAFKIIFETPFHTQKDLDGIWDIFQTSDEYAVLSPSDCEYIKKTVADCFANLAEVDAVLTGSLKNWSIDRIPKVNLAIMRLALSEMKYGGIPYQISINEAVELAKKFGDDQAPSFINGVLADTIEH